MITQSANNIIKLVYVFGHPLAARLTDGGINVFEVRGDAWLLDTFTLDDWNAIMAESSPYKGDPETRCINW
jgi:hypothetical protein